MTKIAVIVASRANWGRVKSVCKAISEHPQLELQLILAASGIDLEIEYKPSAIIQCQVEGDSLQTMTLTTGLFLTQIAGTLERLKPDIVYAHGDRHEVIAAAIASSYQNIFLAHGEGGDRTGTIDEKVRYAISSLADYHFPVTEQSAERLANMGIDRSRIFTVGSTALDSIANIDLTNNRKEPYVVILHHPNTTKQEDFSKLVDAVSRLSIHKVWVNPNVDPGSKAMLKLIHNQNVEFIKNLPIEEYARLLYNCQCAIGNSSSFIKEGAFLGVPAVVIGDRQENREHAGNVIFSDYHNIFTRIHEQIGKRYPRDFRFGDGTAGQKVAEILSKI